LRRLFGIVSGAVGAAVSLMLITVLFTLVFTVAGIQLFADINGRAMSPRFNFRTSWEAALTVFIVMTGDNWADIMVICMVETSPAACMYFLAVFLMGNWVCTNLLLAIFSECFAADNGQLLLPDDDILDLALPPVGRSAMASGVQAIPTIELEAAALESVESQSIEDSHCRQNRRGSCSSTTKREGLSKEEQRARMLQQSAQARDVFQFLTKEGVFTKRKKSVEYSGRFTALARFAFHPWFDTFILLNIIVSCFILCFKTWKTQTGCLEEPCDAFEWFLWGADMYFRILFTLEMVVWLLLLGIRGYFSKADRWVDFVVVVASYLAFFLPVTRVFRAFRALRVLTHVTGLMTVSRSLLAAIPSIGGVMVLLMFIYFLFGILGVQVFMGRLYFCSATKDGSERLAFDEVPCLAQGHHWVNSMYNFDSIFEAFLSLTVLSVGEGWADIMWSAVDSREPHQAPQLNASPAAALFFVPFMVLGNIFVMQLLIGTLIDTFNEFSLVTMSPSQREWVSCVHLLMKLGMPMPNIPPENRFRRGLWHFCRWRYFDLLIALCTIINVVLMCTEHYPQDPLWSDLNEIQNSVFLAIFILEILIKCIAYGPREYISDNWHKFDVLITFLAGLGVIFSFSGGSSLRVMRIGGVFRLFKRAKRLHKIFRTLVNSMPSLVNITGILFIWYFIYAVIGIEVFGNVPYKPYMNFKHFGYAIPMLFTISTTEGWNTAMEASYPVVVPCPTIDDPQKMCTERGSWFSIPFFITFIAVTSYIMLNAIVTAVVNSFNENMIDSEKLAPIDEFLQQWAKVNRKSRYMPVSDLIHIICTMKRPLGLEYQRPQWHNRGFVEMIRRFAELHIPLSGHNEVWYDSVIASLARWVLQVDVDDSSGLAKRGTLPFASNNVACVHHHIAAVKLSTLVKGRHTELGSGSEAQSPETTNSSLVERMNNPWNSVRVAMALRLFKRDGWDKASMDQAGQSTQESPRMGSGKKGDEWQCVSVRTDAKSISNKSLTPIRTPTPDNGNSNSPSVLPNEDTRNPEVPLPALPGTV